MISQPIASMSGLTCEQLRMIELARQGRHCSEILIFMGLEAGGKTNGDLIKAVSALSGGIGFSGGTCGALTGGACLLGLFAGRGNTEEHEDPKLNIMISELVEWFDRKHGQRYQGTECRNITEDDPRIPPTRCPRIVDGVFSKVRSLLAENGYVWPTRS